MQQPWLYLTLALIPSVQIPKDMYKFRRIKVSPFLASYFYTVFSYSVNEKRKKGGKERKFSVRENTLAIYIMSYWEMYLKRSLKFKVRRNISVILYTSQSLNAFLASWHLQWFPFMTWPADWVGEEIN